MKVVRNEKEIKEVNFADLNPGDCFEHEGDLCIKSQYEQDAISLTDGEQYEDMCGDTVILVNAEIHITD